MISARTLIAVSACALTGGATAVEAASAATNKPGPGNYLGRAVHPPFFGLTDVDPFTTPLVLMVGKGELSGISVKVRMECPDETIRDVEYHRLRIPESKRPKLTKSGGFRFHKNGIHISGHIGKHVAEGTISARGHGCSVSNVTFTARKKRYRL